MPLLGDANYTTQALLADGPLAGGGREGRQRASVAVAEDHRRQARATSTTAAPTALGQVIPSQAVCQLDQPGLLDAARSWPASRSPPTQKCQLKPLRRTDYLPARSSPTTSGRSCRRRSRPASATGASRASTSRHTIPWQHLPGRRGQRDLRRLVARCGAGGVGWRLGRAGVLLLAKARGLSGRLRWSVSVRPLLLTAALCGLLAALSGPAAARSPFAAATCAVDQVLHGDPKGLFGAFRIRALGTGCPGAVTGGVDVRARPGRRRAPQHSGARLELQLARRGRGAAGARQLPAQGGPDHLRGQDPAAADPPGGRGLLGGPRRTVAYRCPASRGRSATPPARPPAAGGSGSSPGRGRSRARAARPRSPAFSTPSATTLQAEVAAEVDRRAHDRRVVVARVAMFITNDRSILISSTGSRLR